MGFRRPCPCRSHLFAGLGLIPFGSAGIAEIGRQRISRPDRVLGVHHAEYAAMGAIDARHDSKFTATGTLVPALRRVVCWFWRTTVR